jgi:hypothetical protein
MKTKVVNTKLIEQQSGNEEKKRLPLNEIYFQE